MKLSIKHRASRIGLPVFVDDEGKPMTYSKGIKTTRNILGITQGQLAHLVGVSVRTVQSWESGTRLPGEKALAAMRPVVKKAKRVESWE